MSARGQMDCKLHQKNLRLQFTIGARHMVTLAYRCFILNSLKEAHARSGIVGDHSISHGGHHTRLALQFSGRNIHSQ